LHSNQRRAFAGARAAPRALNRLVHGQHVVAVDRDAVKAIPFRALGHVLDRHALLDRHRVGVEIVLADEQDRQLVDAGKIERFVEVAVLLGALAESRQCKRCLSPPSSS
jgi:nucleoside-diphosphate-sugar epimerase